MLKHKQNKFVDMSRNSKDCDGSHESGYAISPKFYKIEHFGISEIGLVRLNNEDLWSALPSKQFFILADGMGGHRAGEVAASFAVESMCKSINDLPTTKIQVEEACQYLREAIAKANSKVFNESRIHPDYAGMGTTLSCFMIVEKFLIYAHIGDSRLYRYRNELEQLTEDHSLRYASSSKEETSPLPSPLLRNVITRAVGTQTSVLPDIGVIPLFSKDLYMLCSDGLSDYVEEAKIARILSYSSSLEEMGKNLVKLALEKGGNDNITLLLVKVL
jgi:serine/threonine protein phosphatase PrpC